MKIPFDIKYRPEVESGEYKVINDNGYPIDVIKWDAEFGGYPVVCLCGGMAYNYSRTGRCLDTDCSNIWIVTPDPEPSEFEECFIKEIEEVHGAVVPLDKGAIRSSCDKLLEIAKKEVMKYLSKWNEEDEDKIVLIEKAIYSLVNDGITFTDATRLCDWLKSLRPQNTWKPSDKQMKLLKEACDQHWEPDGLDPLYTLYQDLKKLREE